MGFAEGIQGAVALLVIGALVYLLVEVRRMRKAIEASDAAQKQHREQMITFGANVLREVLDVAREQGVGSTGIVNDNATHDDDAHEGAEVIPLRRDDDEPGPSQR